MCLCIYVCVCDCMSSNDLILFYGFVLECVCVVVVSNNRPAGIEMWGGGG